MKNLIPLQTFLHRIFPAAEYNVHDVVNRRIFQPRKDSTPFELHFPLDWEQHERRDDRNWRMQLQGWTMFHNVMNIFDSYADKDRIVDYFLDVAGDWYSQYGQDDPHTIPSRMPASYAWYDMSVGFRALVLGFFLNRFAVFDITLPRARTELLERLVDIHVQNLSFEKAFSLNNHGMFQVHGLMALIETDARRYSSFKPYVFEKMEELLRTQFDRHGVHVEHSPHYHFYALSTFESVLASGWYSECPNLEATIAKARRVCKWLVDPLKRPACIGDSILTTQKNINFDLTEQATPYFDEARLIASDFSESGYQIVRSPWHTDSSEACYLFLMGAYHSRVHKHRDCLSFEWFDKGSKIVCDGGKYGYKSDKFRNYFLSSAAHNGLTIEGFDVLKMKPYGSAIRSVSSDLEPTVVQLRAALDYAAFKHERTLHLKANSWLLIEDNFESKRPRQITQTVHLSPDFALKRSSVDGHEFRSSSVNRLYVACLSPGTEARLVRGTENPVQGFVSEKDYSYRPAFTLENTKCTQSDKIITVLALGRAELEDAQRFARRHIQANLKNFTVYEPENVRLLPSVPHHSSSQAAFKSEDNRFTTIMRGTAYSFPSYLHRKDSPYTLVMFPGAADRSKPLPPFQRYTWSDDIAANVIIVTDPTISASNDLSIGWFQGSNCLPALSDLWTVVRELFDGMDLSPSRATFFGSSAGGFAALKAAEEFADSSVVAINPQIDVLHYTPAYVHAMLRYSYPELSREQADVTYGSFLRATVDPARNGRTYIYQNVHDQAHMERHLKPLLRRTGLLKGDNELPLGTTEIGTLSINLYSDELSHHSPPGKDTTLAWLDPIIRGASY